MVLKIMNQSWCAKEMAFLAPSLVLIKMHIVFLWHKITCLSVILNFFFVGCDYVIFSS